MKTPTGSQEGNSQDAVRMLFSVVLPAEDPAPSFTFYHTGPGGLLTLNTTLFGKQCLPVLSTLLPVGGATIPVTRNSLGKSLGLRNPIAFSEEASLGGL